MPEYDVSIHFDGQFTIKITADCARDALVKVQQLDKTLLTSKEVIKEHLVIDEVDAYLSTASLQNTVRTEINQLENLVRNPDVSVQTILDFMAERKILLSETDFRCNNRWSCTFENLVAWHGRLDIIKYLKEHNLRPNLAYFEAWKGCVYNNNLSFLKELLALDDFRDKWEKIKEDTAEGVYRALVARFSFDMLTNDTVRKKGWFEIFKVVYEFGEKFVAENQRKNFATLVLEQVCHGASRFNNAVYLPTLDYLLQKKNASCKRQTIITKVLFSEDKELINYFFDRGATDCVYSRGAVHINSDDTTGILDYMISFVDMKAFKEFFKDVDKEKLSSLVKQNTIKKCITCCKDEQLRYFMHWAGYSPSAQKTILSSCLLDKQLATCKDYIVKVLIPSIGTIPIEEVINGKEK